MKEIHFYTNLNNIEQVSDWDLETMNTDYVSTSKAIDNENCEIVKTTQLSFLIDSWYYIYNKEYKIYIHNDNKIYEVKEHMDSCTDMDIKYGYNICKLLLGGVFGKLK